MKVWSVCLMLVLALPLAAETGPVRTYVTAADLLDRATATGDAALAAVAHRLARSVALRPAAGWQRTGEDTAAPSATGYPRDPGAGAVAALALVLAEGEPDLALLVAEALAVPLRPAGAASAVTGVVGPDATQEWRVAFFGATPAETGLIATGPGALTLQVLAADGTSPCPQHQSAASFCGFVPPANGWFTLRLTNPGDEAVPYLLLTN